jgi:hypothetical protein
MLRGFVLLLAIALIAFGLWTCVAGPTAWPVLIWGIVLLLATLFERWRYRANAPRTGDGWVATEERFIDPESGKLVQVYYQASTGERRYEPVD